MAEDLAGELGKNIPLYEMLQTLRSELQASMEASEGQALKLQVDQVEIELDVVISRKADGKGGVNLGVVSFGGGGERSTAQTHKFRLKLKPVFAADAGQPVQVTAEVDAPVE